mmetsp:Transcript_52319/g.150758  ORF Transcript_52319/g.150758 Transcript_52319/m.150758 type:complete len:700 (-) Transcript_52319:14-2113(-)
MTLGRGRVLMRRGLLRWIRHRRGAWSALVRCLNGAGLLGRRRRRAIGVNGPLLVCALVHLGARRFMLIVVVLLLVKRGGHHDVMRPCVCRHADLVAFHALHCRSAWFRTTGGDFGGGLNAGDGLHDISLSLTLAGFRRRIRCCTSVDECAATKPSRWRGLSLLLPSASSWARPCLRLLGLRARRRERNCWHNLPLVLLGAVLASLGMPRQRDLLALMVHLHRIASMLGLSSICCSLDGHRPGRLASRRNCRSLARLGLLVPMALRGRCSPSWVLFLGCKLSGLRLHSRLRRARLRSSGQRLRGRSTLHRQLRVTGRSTAPNDVCRCGGLAARRVLERLGQTRPELRAELRAKDLDLALGCSGEAEPRPLEIPADDGEIALRLDHRTAELLLQGRGLPDVFVRLTARLARGHGLRIRGLLIAACLERGRRLPLGLAARGRDEAIPGLLDVLLQAADQRRLVAERREAHTLAVLPEVLQARPSVDVAHLLRVEVGQHGEEVADYHFEQAAGICRRRGKGLLLLSVVGRLLDGRLLDGLRSRVGGLRRSWRRLALEPLPRAGRGRGVRRRRLLCGAALLSLTAVGFVISNNFGSLNRSGNDFARLPLPRGNPISHASAVRLRRRRAGGLIRLARLRANVFSQLLDEVELAPGRSQTEVLAVRLQCWERQVPQGLFGPERSHKTLQIAEVELLRRHPEVGCGA